jgi:very-short-patch-repair endonuclease
VAPGWRRVVPGASVADVAVVQRGLIMYEQLLGIGLSSSAISRLVASGRLHRVHRGVYAVGHPLLLPLARELAAVLASGEGCVISHRSAGVVWGLLEDDGGPVDVTRPVGGSRSRRGITCHRDRLEAGDVVIRSGLPLTSCARTLADIASTAGGRLARAVNEAYVGRLVTREELAAVSHRRGAGPLRVLLAAESEPRITRSEAERRLLRLVASAGLPTPRTNVSIAGVEVDVLWPEQRLVVEVDGFAFHGTRAAFERDRARDARLQALGYRVVRVTWRQVTDERHRVVAAIAGALGAGTTRTGPAVWRDAAG